MTMAATTREHEFKFLVPDDFEMPGLDDLCARAGDTVVEQTATYYKEIAELKQMGNESFDKRLRVGGDIKEPKKIKHVPPQYPQIAQTAKVQGVVIIEATIGPNGAVQEAKVLRSIPLLDAAALDAVRQWQFTPTLLNGVPVPVIMTVTVNFTLQ